MGDGGPTPPPPPPDACSVPGACDGPGGNPPSPGGVGPNGNGGPTKSACAGQALKKNAASLAFDAAGVAAGFLPGGDAVVSLAQVGVGIGSTVNSAISSNTRTAEGKRALAGTFGGIFGIQLAALAPAFPAVKAIPVIGAAFSVAGAVADLYQVNVDYQACLAVH